MSKLRGAKPSPDTLVNMGIMGFGIATPGISLLGIFHLKFPP